MADPYEIEGPPPLEDKKSRRRSNRPRQGEFEPTYISVDGRYTFMVKDTDRDSGEIEMRVKYRKTYQTELTQYLRPNETIQVRLMDDGIDSAEFELTILRTDGVFSGRASAFFNITAIIE